jgi:hypothetical protein
MGWLTGRSRDFDGGVGSGRDLSTARLCVLPIDYSQQVGDETNGEQVVGVGEETNTSNYAGTDVVPSKGRLVDFREGETTTLVGIGNVCLHEGEVSIVLGLHRTRQENENIHSRCGNCGRQSYRRRCVWPLLQLRVTSDVAGELRDRLREKENSYRVCVAKS